MNGDEHSGAARETEWLVAFENGFMIFITMLQCEGGRPSAFIGFTVDRVCHREPRRLHVSLGAAEFDLVGYRRIIGSPGFDSELFDEERTFAQQPRAVVHQVRI